MSTTGSSNQEALVTKIAEQNPGLSRSLIHKILEADNEKAAEEYKFS